MARIKILYDAFTVGGTPVYLCVFPEDSTAGGVGLTALNNAILAAYPANYIDTWTALSTGNILDSGFDNGDGVHLSQAGQDEVLSTIIASGKITVLDTFNRALVTAQAPLIQTGVSSSSPYTFAPKRNFLFKADATLNRFIGSNIFDNGTSVVVSTKSTPSPPLALIFNVEGALSTYGSSSSMFLFDRVSSSNYFSFLPNNGILSLLNNSLSLQIHDNFGRMSIGRTEASPPIRSVLEIKRGQTYTTGQSWQGVGFSMDTATYILNNGGAVGLSIGSVQSIARQTISASVAGAGYTNFTSFYIDGEPIAGTNMTITNPYSLYINRGQSYFGGKLNIATGSNASVGTATLVAGTVTINTTAVTSSSKIFVFRNTPGGTLGNLSAPEASIVNGTSFVINSDSSTETSTVYWWIVN